MFSDVYYIFSVETYSVWFKVAMIFFVLLPIGPLVKYVLDVGPDHVKLPDNLFGKVVFFIICFTNSLVLVKLR